MNDSHELIIDKMHVSSLEGSNHHVMHQSADRAANSVKFLNEKQNYKSV